MKIIDVTKWNNLADGIIAKKIEVSLVMVVGKRGNPGKSILFFSHVWKSCLYQGSRGICRRQLKL